MEVGLRELWESGGSLERLAMMDFSVEKLGWKISKILSGAQSEVKILQKSHNNLVRKYGKPVRDDKGEIVTFRIVPLTEESDAYESEWNELLDTAPKVTLWGDPITRAELVAGLGANATMKPGDIVALSWLLKD